MHRCEWIAAKYLDEIICCTEEYVPAAYSCLIVDGRGGSIQV